ncbi:hypothetical protein BKA93DRAFT_738530 [Sparassis latifolia]
MCPGYQVAESDSRYDENDSTKQKPDVALYRESELPVDNRPNWNIQRLHFEFKGRCDQDDPFDDKSEDFESVGDKREEHRGQFIQYAEKLFERQQRCFCFTVMMLGRQARLCRWDRSGAVVTEKFDYVKQSYLRDFLWRFAHLSDVDQGYDPTAIPIPKDSAEADLMRKAASPTDENCAHIREYFRNSLDESWTWWRLKVDVHVSAADSTAHEVKGEYLVGKPHFLSHGMAGRGTRGYVAIDCYTKNFVWLKDAWRVDHAGIEKEGDILWRLNDLKIENVPTVLQHGDILRQRTLSQDYWKAPQSNPAMMKPLKSHTHYRLVEKEVCRPMSDFDSGEDLVHLVWDCVQVHKDAMLSADLIHRDISSGNLLINEHEIEENGTKCVVRDGILSDWELSKPLPGKGSVDGPRQPDRTGTWQFLSVHALNNPYRTITIQDELESFFHVLLYFGIRYLRHNFARVGEFIYSYFDDGIPTGDEWICGSEKKAVIKGGVIAQGEDDLKFGFSDDKGDPGRHPLTDIIMDVLSWFNSYYHLTSTFYPNVGGSRAGAGIMQASPRTTKVSKSRRCARRDARRVNKEVTRKGRDPEEDKRLAKYLESHDEMCLILSDALDNES